MSAFCYPIFLWHREVRSFRVNASMFVFIASLFLCAGNAFGQSAEKESTAVLEIGGAGSRSLTEGQSSFGPAIAVEVTPIENRLELYSKNSFCPSPPLN
jgi:hypothetical protein